MAIAEESRAAAAAIGNYAALEVIEDCERFQANDFETETVAAAETGDQATSDDERDLEAGAVRETVAAAAAAASFSAAALAAVVVAAA